MTIHRHASILLVLLLAVGLSACASANPKEQAAGPEAPADGEPVIAIGTLEGMDDLSAPGPMPMAAPLAAPVAAPVERTYPRSTGVTTDPGTRYLSTGVSGGLTIETPPPPPPGT